MSSADATTHVDDLLALYAAGAADSDEARRVAEHLETCLECRLALSEYEESLSVLAAVLPISAPPSRVRTALMERIGASPQPAGRSNAAQGRFGGWSPRMAWKAAGVGVAAGLLLGFGLGGGFAYLELRDDVDHMEGMVSDGRVFSYLAAAPETAVMVLEADPAAGEMAKGAHAMMMAAPSGRMGVLIVGGMETPPRGRVYQLWVVAEGKQMDGGVFTVDDQGWGQVEFAPPEPMAHIQQVGITVEPAAGSRQPTGTPVLAWVAPGSA